MHFDNIEKDLIKKGLEALKETLARNRSVFEMGSVQRERLENKFDVICDLRNNLDKSDFTPREKTVVFEALDGLKESLVGQRSFFDVGSVRREQLEANLERITNIKNNINKPNSMGSLDSLINAAKQRQSDQPAKYAPQRNNGLEI